LFGGDAAGWDFDSFVRKLAKKQDTIGKWDVECLGFLPNPSVSMKEVSAIKQALGMSSCWATLVLLRFLMRVGADRKVLWGSMGDKANRWLASQSCNMAAPELRDVCRAIDDIDWASHVRADSGW
jgi:hypothetical protein